jgi:hypothetical protein
MTLNRALVFLRTIKNTSRLANPFMNGKVNIRPVRNKNVTLHKLFSAHAGAC